MQSLQNGDAFWSDSIVWFATKALLRAILAALIFALMLTLGVNDSEQRAYARETARCNGRLL